MTKRTNRYYTAELLKLRKENKELRMEKPKKGQRPPAKGNQVTFQMIKQLSSFLPLPVQTLYKVMNINRSAYWVVTRSIPLMNYMTT